MDIGGMSVAAGARAGGAKESAVHCPTKDIDPLGHMPNEPSPARDWTGHIRRRSDAQPVGAP